MPAFSHPLRTPALSPRGLFTRQVHKLGGLGAKPPKVKPTGGSAGIKTLTKQSHYQPLMTPRGRERITLQDMPARCTTSTTWATSL